MANGTFTTAERLNVQNKIEELGLDEAVLRQYRYDPVTFNALKENQMARLDALEGQNKDDKISVHWLEHAKTGSLPEDCDDACDFTGERAGSYTKEYELTDCVQYKFSTTDDTFRTSIFSKEEELARMFLTADLELTKQLNVKSINFLDGEVFQSNYAAASWTNAAGGITIPAAEWNTSLMGHLPILGAQNFMRDYMIVSGQGMWFMNWEANMKDADEMRNKMGTQNMPYFDLQQLDITLANKPTFLVDKSAYAIATKNRYAAGQILDRGHEGRMNYSIPSALNPNVRYDVSERKVCSGTHSDTTHYLVELKVGHFAAPKSVRDTANTGINKLLVG